MNEDKLEGILRKVRALHERAAHPRTNAEESSSCIDAAYRLMAKYSVDQAMVDDSKPKKSSPDNFSVTFGGGYMAQRAQLVNVISKVFSCKSIWDANDDQIYVYGFQSDLDMVWSLIESLQPQMDAEVAAAPISSARFRRSFMSGFSNRVYSRLKDLYQEVIDATPGAALVLADRLPAVVDALATAFPDAVDVAHKTSDVAGHLFGAAAGDRADIFLDNRRVGTLAELH